MTNVESILTQKSFVLIFAYAPAGLGHLRVTDALYEALPKKVEPVLLGAQDKTITNIHRIMSVNQYLREVMEWAQRGSAEGFFTNVYRWYLRSNTKLLEEQLITILDQRIAVPDTVLVVATHFGLAHQLAEIKQRIAEKRNVRIVLAVQVTDDSPQLMWFVPGADVIFVPSQKTKNVLQAYGKEIGSPNVPFEVVAYPVSPLLAKPLHQIQCEVRSRQYNMTKKTAIHMAIPVSGAAVGTEFFTKVIDRLYRRSRLFVFHVIAKSAMYSQTFLQEMISREYVRLHVSSHDREIVNIYQDVYAKNTIGLEITKPSEQAFKALLKPDSVGGSILLFAEPVGRQEYDNVHFLQRHGLIPHKTQNDQLYAMAKGNKPLVSPELKEKAKNWRGLLLPYHSADSAHFIIWGLEQGLFSIMHTCNCDRVEASIEVQQNGADEFWNRVIEYVNEN